ncbi:uncharacterized protein LOC113125197 isoform X2 [Mastacembelus armatus]|nr:uncharacterized protein LOC113125197 isoform X2 [Mastacembelus armatus]
MAGEPSVMHYQLKNSSVCLHVRNPPPYERALWEFAEQIVAGEGINNPKYAGKLDYKNRSLCIKELTDADSGTYKFSFYDPDFKSKSEKHTVIVQEIVPRPVITVSALRSNLSAEFCNITVNCSIHNDWVSSVCDEDSCRTSQWSFSKVNITISTANRTLVCSGHNHVSMNNASENISTMCFIKSDPEHEKESQSPLLIVIVILFFMLLCGFCVFFIKWQISTQYNHNQTSTAQLRQNQTVVAQPQPESRVSTSSSSQAEASYENVEVARQSQRSQTSSTREELGSMQSQKVDTVYSVVQVPPVAPPLGKSESSKDTRGHKPEASAQGEAVSSMQIDTVYSLLQKPKHSKSQQNQQVSQDFRTPKI